MTKPARVINYYLLCNKLKDVIRAGWPIWHVERERLESVAEHVFGVQMLAIAMQSEYQYDVDLEKVILMLAIHELEEIVIGDFIPYDITKAEKDKLGHVAVHDILKDLNLGETLEQLILEMDQRETAEAKFAHACDKLEADIQSCLYYDEGCIAWPPLPNRLLKNPDVKRIVDESSSWPEAWIKANLPDKNYDNNFLAVADYLQEQYSGPRS